MEVNNSRKSNLMLGVLVILKATKSLQSSATTYLISFVWMVKVILMSLIKMLKGSLQNNLAYTVKRLFVCYLKTSTVSSPAFKNTTKNSLIALKE